MGRKYDSLEELRRKKNLLRTEISDLEGLLTFKNTKESLSAFTNGLTDQYLKDVKEPDGEEKTVIRKDVIAKQFTSQLKGMFLNKDAAMGIANSAFNGNAIDGIVKLAVTGIVASYAKKNFKSSNWKKKVLGAVIIYLVPSALKFLRKRLENYQRSKSLSSMEQLI
ncbi:phosphoribosyl-ATP pyrophosphatase [Chryseobacterium sp. Leaf180]|jgi:hypothetical protein|uniref:hypothetical protein n=1 Tax=Chryseobacterium sp. Leaf180 TaxID=1736289 RepID=UPI0007005DAD|nr:hypothetical protein [Chryseobacterium sp. Leaf180]KQR94683.1 phosphoribosyl-ATP pyrophosphatase [Chryseobacterium sp. Leaf180]